MVVSSPSTGTGMTHPQAATECGLKLLKGGGIKHKKNSCHTRVKGRGSNKKQKEANNSDAAVVAEPTNNDDVLSLPDESDSEIEYGDDKIENAGIENVHGLDKFFDERNKPIFKSDTDQRLAIGYMFYKKFGAPENHQEWRDKKICPQSRKVFDLDDGTRIDHILNDTVACKKAGISYTRTRNRSKYGKMTSSCFGFN
jgi:hypothetical protein